MPDPRRPVITVIANQIGRVHHALQHPVLRKTRPCYCYVPEKHFTEGGYQNSRYLISRWPSVNCSANPHGIGSHVLPDPGKPVAPGSRCPILREFLRRLETIATIKIPP